MKDRLSDLRGLSLDELERLVSPRFRASQVFSWAQKKGVGSFEEMRNVPKDVRAALSERLAITPLKTAGEQTSSDGTVKYLWALSDGSHVESVLLDDEGRKTACISTQSGCRMGCAMCATASVRFARNLSAGEIVGQVIQIAKKAGRISNVVYMGMGEPFDNYDNVLKSVRILNHPKGKNIGQRHITISTCGLIPQIARFAEEKLQVRLAISLNSANDDVRSHLLPVNRKYPIDRLLAAARSYSKKTGRRVTFEYILIDSLNDSEDDAGDLARLLRGMKANVNLIEFNSFPGCAMKPPARGTTRKFRAVLEKAGIEVSERYRRGRDIDAACGQLRAAHEN